MCVCARARAHSLRKRAGTTIFRGRAISRLPYIYGTRRTLSGFISPIFEETTAGSHCAQVARKLRGPQFTPPGDVVLFRDEIRYEGEYNESFALDDCFYYGGDRIVGDPASTFFTYSL